MTATRRAVIESGFPETYSAKTTADDQLTLVAAYLATKRLGEAFDEMTHYLGRPVS